MAELLSTELFSFFGWDESGLTNENFKCLDVEAHGRKQSGTHPADTVLGYLDPWTDEYLFLHVDLKSYKAESISKSSIVTSLRHLSNATECANASEEWAEMFAMQKSEYSVKGLLFIFNHDGEYDRDFEKMLSSSSASAIPIKRGQGVYILSPQRIAYLSTIVHDAKETFYDCGLSKDSAEYKFLLPDTTLFRFQQEKADMAPIELMLGPWIIMYFEYEDDGKNQKKYVIYYYESGEDKHEFVYLIDYVFRAHLLRDADQVVVKAVFPHEKAAINFNSAKQFYSSAYSKDLHVQQKHLGGRLDKISFDSIKAVKYQYSKYEIGMKNR
ncbi:MAG: hypothetical protein AAGH72_09335 [Verrucomicrobiota bacterium]